MAVKSNIKKAPAPNVKSIKNTLENNFIEKHALKIAVILGVIGLIIRLYHIGFLTLWVDEYMHAMAAKNFKLHGGSIFGTEKNGVLLTVLNSLFCKVFGLSETVVRMPVAIAGAAAIPVIFILGKKLFNTYVGLIAAVFLTFSQYMIFWSRVDRPYGLVPLTYMLLMLCFWMAYEGYVKKENKADFFNRNELNKKYLLLLPLAFLLAMLTQLQSFLFIFTAGFYALFTAINKMFRKSEPNRFLNKYSVLGILNIVAVILLFTPLTEVIMRPVIEQFLPKNIATLILPNWDEISKVMKTDNRDKSFMTYFNVTNSDFNSYFVFLGWAGFILSLWVNRKAAFYLIAGFVIPVLLMGYVLREPCHAKYLSFIYPVFILAASAGLYAIGVKLVPALLKFDYLKPAYIKTCMVVLLIVFITTIPIKAIQSILVRTEHGNPVGKELSEISFVNWKEPCQYVKENMKKDDIVFATVIQAAQYYLDNDSIVWFRQNHYDAKQRKYVPNEPNSSKNSAYTYEQLVNTVKNNPRGWLLADYYFINALTDPRAREFCLDNMTFHFDASSDGSVQVFSWDQSKPKRAATPIVMELGKSACFQAARSADPSDQNQYSNELTFNLTNVASAANGVQLIVLSEGIDSDQEAFMIINGKAQAFISKPTTGGGYGMQESIVNVDRSAFVEGPNKIQFGYNGDDDINGDNIKGFVVYNINALYK